MIRPLNRATPDSTGVVFRRSQSLFGLLLTLAASVVAGEEPPRESQPAGHKQRQAAAPVIPGVSAGVIDRGTAQVWVSLVLKGAEQEFPNKIPVTYLSRDQIKSPRESFPAFYGCFDWHSSVHGHWLLVRSLRLHPTMDSAGDARALLNRHLTEGNLKRESEFFAEDHHKTFERMYGWAWFLRLTMELDQWQEDPDARRWRSHVKPLEKLFVQRITDYLPLLTYPIRTGQHTDTGFALGQVIDYARLHGNKNLERLAVQRARDFFVEDRDFPFAYEPSGHDFFSTGWNEADLMRRVLSQAEFVDWFLQFAPELERQLSDGTIEPVGVSDVSDPKIVHLAGLNLNRAWCMQGVARSLPAGHRMRPLLLRSAEEHLAGGLAYINSGHYSGDHWLATFGLYAASRVSVPTE